MASSGILLRPEQYERYKRHLTLPEVGVRGQQALLQSRVLLIGAGGLGGPLAQYPAAAGVARERLADLNPDVRIETHAVKLTSANALELLADYDVIVDGTDNFPTRY